MFFPTAKPKAEHTEKSVSSWHGAVKRVVLPEHAFLGDISACLAPLWHLHLLVCSQFYISALSFSPLAFSHVFVKLTET